MTEGVDRNDRVSGNDKEVSEDISIGLITWLGSPWENVGSFNAEVFVMKWGWG